MDQIIATRMQGCDFIVHCPWLSFVWMCEFILCLYVGNAEERGSSSLTVCDGKTNLNKTERTCEVRSRFFFGTVWNGLST